jgi:hypothetical protein
MKNTCKECKGSSFCEHNRIKSKCKECGGGSICEHDKIKQNCKECGGSAFCEHHKYKTYCKECGGSAYCEHGKQKSKCKECSGSQICEHHKLKSYCKECGGSAYCEHNKLKSYCKECGGSAYCEHNKIKRNCRECLSLGEYLVLLQRANLRRVLNQSNINKTKSSIEYLGCSVEYFIEYIKSKMTDEMTFDNIHIDHIKPVSRFNLGNEEEFLDCVHYSNFQALLTSDNLSKSNKWSDEDELIWNENIKGKEYNKIYMPV